MKMKSKFIAVAIAAGLASPAAASTFLDFTSSSIDTPGSLAGFVEGVGYTISSGGGALTNATHWNNIGCAAAFGFACSASGNSYDVGFGVQGGNNNEVDGIAGNEYVQVLFNSLVNITGFAGMLTYDDSVDPISNTEQAELLYSSDGGTTWSSLLGITQNTDADIGGTNNTFGTVGLSYLDGFSVQANVVRFKAQGTGTFDDGNANITAAGLEVAAVPVPAALPLLLAGVGAFGWAARRKNRKAA